MGSGRSATYHPMRYPLLEEKMTKKRFDNCGGEMKKKKFQDRCGGERAGQIQGGLFRDAIVSWSGGGSNQIGATRASMGTV